VNKKRKRRFTSVPRGRFLGLLGSADEDG